MGSGAEVFGGSGGGSIIFKFEKGNKGSAPLELGSGSVLKLLVLWLLVLLLSGVLLLPDKEELTPK